MPEVQPSVSKGKRVCKACHEEVTGDRHKEHCPFFEGPLTYHADCPECQELTEVMWRD